VFAHVETSRDPTHMGGIVLPLLRNRRQDFDLCRYRLVEQFPKFLEVRPIEATRAAVVSLNRFITSEHLIPYWPKDGDFEGKLQHFVFRDGEANYVADGSYIWDEGPYADEPIKIADELFKLIGSLTSSQEDLLLLDRLLDVLRDEAWMAFFWRRLLRTAGETSEVFAPQLFELCVAAPIKAHSETMGSRQLLGSRFTVLRRKSASVSRG
jgi:hypothetical protein